MQDFNRKIGPYTLIRKIGRGAFGIVWLAEKQSALATTQFALKLPRNEDLDLEAFRQEATIWLQASGHPNVLPLIEADIQGEQVIIVSEYLPDGSLAEWINHCGGKAPTLDSACEIISGVLAGLAHLHSRRIIHRDLKPENILMQGNTPRLADFGIARLLRSGSYSTNVSGTLSYMAPEAFDGKRNEQTDIWAVGVIFYQLIAGRLPYDQEDTPSFVGAVLRYDPPALPASVPPVLRRILSNALRRDLGERYASAEAMQRDLREADRILWLEQRQSREAAPTQRYPITEAEGTNERQAATLREEKTPQDKETVDRIEARQLRQQIMKRPRGKVASHEKQELQAKKARFEEEARRRQDEEAKTRKVQAECDVSLHQEPAASETQLREGGEQTSFSSTELSVKAPPPTIKSDAPDAKGDFSSSSMETLIAPPPKKLTADQLLPLATWNPEFGSSLDTPRNRRPMIAAAVVGVILIGGIFFFLWLDQGSTLNTKNASTNQNSNPSSNQSPVAPAGMVYVPGGTFMMGRDDGDVAERPAHEVTVKPFDIDIYEVTDEDYLKFVHDTDRAPRWTRGRKPVTDIRWVSADRYCTSTGKRLPTEEEWEFAARGSDGRRWPWGDQWVVGHANANSASTGLVDVGFFKGASPFGLLDMVGNAWEWTASDFVAYPGGSLPANLPPGPLKVIRGGSYQSDKNSATTTYRRGYPTHGNYDYSKTGFRCVKDMN
jgi:formylglycine-generating enzyme required for sulfatase activity